MLPIASATAFGNVIDLSTLSAAIFRVGRGRLGGHPVLVDDLQGVGHGEQALELDVADDLADLAGDLDLRGGIAGPVGQLHAVDDNGDGQCDHGE